MCTGSGTGLASRSPSPAVAAFLASLYSAQAHVAMKAMALVNPRSRSRSPMQTSAPADRRRTTPKTTKSRRRTRQSSESNMNSNGSERRRTLEAPELLRSRDPPPGSILAALRRTESSLTHGAATPVHCRGTRPPGSGTSILPIGGGDIPTGPWTAAPEEKTFLVEEI